ncbi:MAG: zinc ribbon domain-containing protein [Chloroflexota bacterium]|nr:zinc ribbon domain-containing protein [Chloroflexota bacterium]
MQEVRCPNCGHSADVDDREPIWGAGGSEEALKCPECGHLDLVSVLNTDARRLVFEAAVSRWLVRLKERVQPRSEPKGVA